MLFLPPLLSSLALSEGNRIPTRPPSFIITPSRFRRSALTERPATRFDEPAQTPPYSPIAAVSLLGMIETAYLTLDHSQSINTICSTEGSCGDVLHGPYSFVSLSGVDVPLSLLGLGSYTAVFCLAGSSLLSREGREVYDDTKGMEIASWEGNKRIALLGMTTFMGSFSIYLVSLLIGVLHQSCLFCFLSAGFSVSMAALSWFGGVLPSGDDGSFADGWSPDAVASLIKRRVITGASSVGLATVIALVLFSTADDSMTLRASNDSSEFSGSVSGTLLASAGTATFAKNIPPPITTTSSPMAISLASDLSSLHSRMYGAFWCSHCYDQKQSLGYEANLSIPYVECDREGYRNQRDLCSKRDVPGYPTWEIDGELYPGERSLDELREIVDGVLKKKGGA